ncbi:MAG: hypothetical protein JWM33_348 [Caulobacteraceae bacterium]|nr:hypothetical protein [Caulobacteraceae bacterium]
MAHPETLLRRAVGSKDAFVLAPTRLPDLPDAPEKAAIKRAPIPEPAPPTRSPANRSKLDVAEEAVTTLDDTRKREEASSRREAEDLEARRAAAQGAYVAARKTATAKVVDARSASRKAGGED